MDGSRGQAFTPDPVRRVWGGRERIIVANPAAGANWKYTLQGDYVDQLVAVYFKVVTSAQAASRVAALQVVDADGKVWERFTSPTAQVASKTVTYSFMRSYRSAVQADEAHQSLALPFEPLHGGWSLESSIANIASEDQISEARLLVTRFEPSYEHKWQEAWHIADELLRVKELLERA